MHKNQLIFRIGIFGDIVQKPRHFDTATLNYNWQIWGMHAFSLYTTNTARVDEESAAQAEDAVLVDSTNMTQEETVEAIVRIVEDVYGKQ